MFKISDKLRAVLVGIFILVAYGVLAGFLTKSKMIVMFADVISGLAVIGIAVLMYPLFKRYKLISRSYLVLKYAEGVSMIIAGVLLLTSATLRDVIYKNFHIYVFIISGFMFYYLLYKSSVVPRFISIWGVIAMFALTVSTILGLIGIHYVLIDYLLALIITNEVFLALWLMIKGFDK